MSALIGKLGTVLAALAAGLSDFHAVATAPDVSVALTAIVGWLVGHHIVTGAQAKRVETDALSTVRRMADVVEGAVHGAQQAGYRPPAA